MNEFLQETFGEEALTFEQFNEKLSGSENIKLANVADGSYVTKEDYDNINGQLADAKANEEKYADFEAQLQAAKDEGTNALNAYKLEVEISKALVAANAVDEVSVKANLKLDDIKFGEDGSLTGLNEQLEELKKNKPFLFKTEEKKLNLGGPTQGIKVKKSSGLGAAISEHYNKN